MYWYKGNRNTLFILAENIESLEMNHIVSLVVMQDNEGSVVSFELSHPFMCECALDNKRGNQPTVPCTVPQYSLRLPV